MAIKWTKEMEIGVEVIDNQHKALVEKISDFLDACTAGKSKHEIGNMLEFLSDYVITHFETEEGYQIKYNYPEYEQHKRLHENLLEDVKKMKEEFSSDGVSLKFKIEFNKKIVNWLISHIGKVDKELGKHINANK